MPPIIGREGAEAGSSRADAFLGLGVLEDVKLVEADGGDLHGATSMEQIGRQP